MPVENLRGLATLQGPNLAEKFFELLLRVGLQLEEIVELFLQFGDLRFRRIQFRCFGINHGAEWRNLRLRAAIRHCLRICVRLLCLQT